MLDPFDIWRCDEDDSDWWWIILKVGVFTALVVWFVMYWQNKKRARLAPESAATPDVEIPLPEAEPLSGPDDEAPALETEPTPVAQPDNFRKIEGIGPKIERILHESGILTYRQLAETPPVEIKRVLRAAGLTLGDPTTWPEQAALAAQGDWDALRQLQSTLKGGRRIAD